MLDQIDQPLGCADRNASAGLIEESDLLFQFEVLGKLQECQNRLRIDSLSTRRTTYQLRNRAALLLELPTCPA